MNYLDPTERLCRYRYSYTDRLSEITPDMLPRAYPNASFPLEERTKIVKRRSPTKNPVKTTKEPLKSPAKSAEKVFGTVSTIFKQEDIQISNVTNLPPIKEYVDIQAYTELQLIKSQYNHPNFIEARNAINPFENLGNSIFMNRAAIKLANIDAIYNITDNSASYRNYRDDNRLSFCDVCGAPGGFTQYLQFRFTRAFGLGISLQSDDKSLNWRESDLDITRFIIEKGDGSGNLFTNWKYFGIITRNMYTDGVDLICSDGGIDVDKTEVVPISTEENVPKVEEGFVRQEFLSSRLLLTQILTALVCVRNGGNFVCKVFDSVTELSAQLIYILTLSFQSVSFFKPISSRPANSERYIVALGRKEDVTYYISLLAKANEKYDNNLSVVKLFSDPLPKDYVNWLYEQNMLSVARQITVGKQILDLLAGEEVKVPEYDVRRALIYWNLPDNFPGKKSKIQIPASSYGKRLYFRSRDLIEQQTQIPQPVEDRLEEEINDLGKVRV